MKKYFIHIIILLYAFVGNAQSILSEQQYIDTVLNRSLPLSNARLQINAQQSLQKTSWKISDPELVLEQNPFESLTLSIDQSFHFPLQYIRQGRLNTELVHLTESEFAVNRNEIINQTKKTYLQLQYLQAKLNLLRIQDSLSLQLKNAVSNNYEAGNSTYLEKLYGETSYGETHREFLDAQTDLFKLQSQIQIQSGLLPLPDFNHLSKREVLNDSIRIPENPYLRYAVQNQNVSLKQYQKTRSESLPDILLGYTIPLEEDPVYVPSFKAGITIPLWYNSYRGYNQNAKTEMAIAENNVQLEKQNLMQATTEAYLNYDQREKSLYYYEHEGLPQADEMIKTAKRLYEAGEIDFISFLRFMQDAFEIKIKYITALYEYNYAVLQIEYLKGN